MATRKSHKARGATFETDSKDMFRSHAYNAERLARTGAKDEGDLVVKDWLGFKHVVVECKAPGLDGSIDLPGWLREASVERGHYADARNLSDGTLGVVLIKARGKGIEDAYLVIRFGDML
jgi:hypothetical protein